LAEPFLDDTSHSTCSAFKNSSRSVSVNVLISLRTYLTHMDVCNVRMVDMSCANRGGTACGCHALAREGHVERLVTSR